MQVRSGYEGVPYIRDLLTVPLYNFMCSSHYNLKLLIIHILLIYLGTILVIIEIGLGICPADIEIYQVDVKGVGTKR